MSRWKNNFVAGVLILLGASFFVFLVTGYTALYWAWIRGNLTAALPLPLLPWARNFGTLAMITAAVALAILFASRSFPVAPKFRLCLSLLAALSIGFFAEFRNEGKFHFKSLVHFFGPGTWVHNLLNRFATSLGDVAYRIEYSYWNDFLMGPAIVSILFALVFAKMYGAYRNRGSISLMASTTDDSSNLDQTMRFARILMNVGLFWLFIQAWAEKAGYMRNPHSSDEIDLPFEFAGTMLGFWMARALTKPFDGRYEKFRSTLLIDFLSAGVIGLIYTFIVGPLTEGIASNIGHALYLTVPASLDLHEYTTLQRHMRPLELLLLAGAMWCALNWFAKTEEMVRLGGAREEPEIESKSYVLVTLGKSLGVTVGYVVMLAIMVSLFRPEGIGWTIATVGSALGVSTGVFFLLKRAGQ